MKRLAALALSMIVHSITGASPPPVTEVFRVDRRGPDELRAKGGMFPIQHPGT